MQVQPRIKEESLLRSHPSLHGCSFVPSIGVGGAPRFSVERLIDRDEGWSHAEP